MRCGTTVLTLVLLMGLGGTTWAQDCVLGPVNAEDEIAQIPMPFLIQPDVDCTCDNIEMLSFDVDLFIWNHLIPTSYSWDGTQTDFTFTAELLDAVWDPNTGALYPGDPICTATVTVASPVWCDICLEQDHYAFSQVFTFTDCSCADGGYPYYLQVWTTGSGPEGTVPYVFTEGGYPDLVAYADCCDPPVPNEERTWGSLKSLYR